MSSPGPTIKPEERDKRQGALRTAVKQVLDDWTADYRKKGETPPASIEAAVGRLLAARGRLLAKFHVSYAKELPDGWDDYRKALQWLRGGATADDHAYAAKLCYGIVDEAVYPLLARRDLTSGDLPPAARAA